MNGTTLNQLKTIGLIIFSLCFAEYSIGWTSASGAGSGDLNAIAKPTGRDLSSAKPFQTVPGKLPASHSADGSTVTEPAHHDLEPGQNHAESSVYLQEETELEDLTAVTQTMFVDASSK